MRKSSWGEYGAVKLQHLRIPRERVGSLIGRKGETRKLIEKETGVELRIDSAEGEVEIDYRRCTDPSMALVAVDIVKAIGRGFSPKNALLLINDDYLLEVIDIRDYVGKKPNHVIRLRSRIIGSNGKTRKLIEDLTDTHISVYGNTVSIIGGSEQMTVCIRAVDLLLSGSEHSTVYHFLEKHRAVIKIAGMGFD
ncbi:MAG TPA: RNA-processing protein [Euryarchaeota archaeon]|mgnify:CR=1 FL=1|nr:RNA-processing protein [Euryarchaeota archaeon]